MPLRVPVLRLRNRLDSPAFEYERFLRTVWQEAADTFTRAGIPLDVLDRDGEIRPYPSGLPRIEGLARDRVNVVLTGRIPLIWDGGRAIGGVSTVYHGMALSVISLGNAHGNRVPYVAVNTVVHEVLHVLLGDIYAGRPGWWETRRRETRVDWQATDMWLWKDATGVRAEAPRYLARLSGGRSEPETGGVQPLRR